MTITPLIAPDIFALRPDFAAVSVHARFVVNGPPQEIQPVGRDNLGFAWWADDHLEAWRDAYEAFGAKPKRTPCSADALRKRVERDGALPGVNAIVDLYNAVSVQYALPIGGEDVVLYAGSPTLVVARGGEPFDTVANGVAKTEGVEPGEIIWRDDKGVTCRRWNWRQGVRTRITLDTREMWFVLERLEPMPIDALHEAARQLMEGLRRLSPEAEVSAIHIDASGQMPLPDGD
jgi:DNA/RNA-binding domain of Phe-tRNA-synthetase-like protein